MIIVYDKYDNVLGQFEDFHEAEIFAWKLTSENTVYIDCEGGFYEYPKKED